MLDGDTFTAPNFLNWDICSEAPAAKTAGWARPLTRVSFSVMNCLTIGAKSAPVVV